MSARRTFVIHVYDSQTCTVEDVRHGTAVACSLETVGELIEQLLTSGRDDRTATLVRRGERGS